MAKIVANSTGGSVIGRYATLLQKTKPPQMAPNGTRALSDQRGDITRSINATVSVLTVQPNDAVYVATEFHLIGPGRNIRIGSVNPATCRTGAARPAYPPSTLTAMYRDRQVETPKTICSMVTGTEVANNHGKSNNSDTGYSLIPKLR